MTAGTEVVAAGRGEHVVLFYRDEQELAERVGEYLRPAVQDGGLAVVAATPDHRRSVEERLAEAGVDVAAARERGFYLALDASETMRRFMVAGWPDPAGFWLAISPLLQQAPTAGIAQRRDDAVGKLHVQCDQEGVQVGDHDDFPGSDVYRRAGLGHCSLPGQAFTAARRGMTARRGRG